MKITGELLKAERIKKNLTVAEVANTLKLSSKIITAIEAGDTDELPAKTFIRGFVKSYASLLKLDSDLILRQFQEEMGTTQPIPKQPIPQPSAVSTSSTESTEEKTTTKAKTSLTQTTAATLDLEKDTRKRTILYLSIACGLIAVIAVINNTVEKYQKEAVVDKNKIEQIQPITPPSTESSPTANQPAQPATQAVTNPPTSPAPVTAPVDAAEKPSAPSTTALPIAKTEEAKPMSPVSPSQQAARAAQAAATANNSLDDFEPSAGKPVELIIEAKKEAEFFYAKGNTKNFVRVKLAPKEIHVIRSATGLHIKAEDGGLLNLTVNGIEKGAAGSNGKPVRLSF